MAASRQLPKTVGALAGDDSADIADSGCAGSGAGRDVMERQRTGGAKPHPGGGTVLTLFPEQKRIVNLRSQVTMALKKYRPQADDTRLLAELSAIASTLKSASLSDIEMRGFTFDQKRQTLHLQLRAANFASFDKLRSALATDYVVQQDALQKEGDAVSGGVTLRRK
ncbi:GspL-like protein [Escherichia coli]|uniref:GspL-like protein n=1 Tax=Escherichia coli TaxID=562 RepID=A0A376TTL4_ECOLX|nr:GspL-like protein [Escherichia coli]